MRGRNPRSLGVAIALMATVLLAPLVTLAQSATPAASPVAGGAGSGEAYSSGTREEFIAQMIEELGIGEGVPGGTFIDPATQDIQTLQPMLAEEQDSLAVAGLLFDQLVGGNPLTGQPAPTGLADSWDVAADGRTYTFHLNTKAQWTDGVDVTADDVIFSLDSLANEDVGSAYTGSFTDTAESWRKLDDDTVEIVAKEPFYTFLYDIVLWIIPKHIWESVPVNEWATDPGATGADPARVVSSGPFKFQEWRQGESVTLVRNDNYYDKVPYIETYNRRIWPDQTAVVNAFLNGELDATGLAAQDVAAVEGQPGVTVGDYSTRGFSMIELNLDPEITTLFVDKGVRQAMMYALDRESIVNDIQLGYAEVANGTQPVISYAYDPDAVEPKYGYDPEKAKQLLADAGWADSDGDGIVDKDGQKFTFEIMYPPGSPTTEQLVAYVQDAWGQIGIEATPRSIEFPAMIQTLTEDHTWDVALLGFSWDATFIQDAMFGCAQYVGGFNDMKYCNPEVDALNARAKRTFDDAERAALLGEAGNIVNDELPVLVMYFRKDIYAFNDKLQNYAPGPWGGIPFSYVWIQE